MRLLEVSDLTVSFPTPDGLVQAVRGLSFGLDAGQTLGIVGESGSGKSVSTQTIAGLTRGARVTGTALFDGEDLLAMDAHRLRGILGGQIAMIFQDPLSSLHPYYRIGWQIVEMIREHTPCSRREATGRAIELLGLVGIPEPEQRIRDYPHQFSGGMRQRVMIAMALALHPRLLVADEPTTALDVTVQAQILELMQDLQRRFGIAIILITHDLGVVAGMADEVLVMYAGRAMEHSPRRDLYYRPHHPYTVGLLDSLPEGGDPGERLRPIPGQPPSMIDPPSGCPFHPRCGFAMDRCAVEAPPLRPVPGAVGTHGSACWLPLSLLGRDGVADRRAQYAAAHRSAQVVR
ncbi:MAG: ABC transporter ATP-binding protein [Jatrophihabitans sp.]|nr:MAG: ABC transporter ATP-binding protein [Jatrophihabitans sp.]